MRSSAIALRGDLQRLAQPVARHRILADRKRAIGLDGEKHRLVRPLLPLRGGRTGRFDRDIDGRERRRDHEDDQQHQDHVDERRDVDLVGLREIVAVVPEPDRHGATPPRAAARDIGALMRSQSRLTSRITSAEPSAEQRAIAADRAREHVVDHHRGNGGEQAERGREQRFGDAGRDHREVGGVRVRDADEAVHDAPHGAEQADEGRGRADGGEQPHAAADAAARRRLDALEQPGDALLQAFRIGMRRAAAPPARRCAAAAPPVSSLRPSR